jgi:hypothetical protein
MLDERRSFKARTAEALEQAVTPGSSLHHPRQCAFLVPSLRNILYTLIENALEPENRRLR